jgi:hypothetical protein
VGVVQGGDDWTAVGSKNPIVGLGASEIPAATREQQEANPLQRAHAGLALTAAPANMPCRGAERAQITKFVEEAVLAGTIVLCFVCRKSLHGYLPCLLCCHCHVTAVWHDFPTSLGVVLYNAMIDELASLKVRRNPRDVLRPCLGPYPPGALSNRTLAFTAYNPTRCAK